MAPHHLLLYGNSREKRSAMNSSKHNARRSLPTTPSPAQLPATPPSSNEKQSHEVDDILRLFRLRKKGKPFPREWVNQPWIKLPLSLKGYQELLQRLEKDEDLKGFFEDKIRYDFDPVFRHLTIRVPTLLHESFIRQVCNEIDAQLRHQIITANSTIADVLRSINECGSPTTPLADSTFRCPDATFFQKKVKYPPVVLEVSYSQKRKDLPRLAHSYIINSGFSIQMVVGLDIEYKKTKKATVSVWRAVIKRDEDGEAGFCERVVNAAPFRTAEGEPVKSGDLVLRLNDFALAPTLKDVPEADREIPVVSISFQVLAQLLADAEEFYTTLKSDTSLMTHCLPGKRSRDSSSSPESSGDDTITARERRAQREEDADENWTPGNGRGRKNRRIM